MGLTPERTRRHIAEWSERLRPSPRNALWPQYLFHAAHVTTAAQILRSGVLACRNRLSSIDHDVANQGALHNNPRAHDFARLYFRPRNLFHLKTEGIKCRQDPFRDRNHMSIPVMLAFDAFSVLTLPSAGFSTGMLSRVRDIGEDNRFFDRIPMERVYHDAPPVEEEREEIQDARMAEVVVRSRLLLVPHLRFVICRTPLDRRTLLHLLGSDAVAYRERIVVESIPRSIFFHQGLYLTRADLSSAGLRLEFHPPKQGPASGWIKIRLTTEPPGQEPDSYDLEIPGGLASVTAGAVLPSTDSCWRIEIEDVLAFHAKIPSQTTVVAG